ncbi:MAG: SRPBCC family protein [Solirubrobacterales bacterium]
MIESSGELYIDARSEQVWMFIDNANCLAHWLSFAQQIEVLEGEGLGRKQVVSGNYHVFCDRVEQEVVIYEPARQICWSHTEEHPSNRRVPRLDRTTTISVLLIPEGAGTRVRIESAQEPAGLLRGLAMRLMTHRSLQRHIHTSLAQLEGMVKGRMAV